VKLARNVAAGMVSSIWTALLGLAVVPQYLKYLGIEAYGLIAFFATTQVLFQILDMGMAPTINREIARCSASGRWDAVRNLLHTLGIIYWCVAGIICAIVVGLAPVISGHWLKSKALQEETITHALMLMGLVIACRWPIGLYQSALNGLQRIAVSSGINIVMATLGSLGAVCVLAFVSPTINAFFLWQAGVGFCYALMLRWGAWRALGSRVGTIFDVSALRSIWRFSASMMALTFSALVFTQLDKVLLSKLLTLAAFGQYALAGVVASALNILITPFYNAIYPRFSAYVVQDQTTQSLELYRVSGRLLATMLFPVAMVISIVGEDLIRLWTGNPQLAADVAPLAALLAIGTAVHGTMYIPHALLLSQGKTFIPLTINLVLLVIMIPITVHFALVYGAFGGALAWLVLHLLYVILWTGLMQRYSGNPMSVTWLLHEIGVPFIVCGVTGYLVRIGIQSVGLSTDIKLVLALLASLLSVAATFAVSPEMRSSVLSMVRAELGR
jgi:O-antigen/teichoic acid export membrane protein